MRFYESSHCRSKVHCALCRDLVAGKPFREQLVAAFRDLQLPDFICPDGEPWRSKAPGSAYETTRQAILSSPPGEPWDGLREELRLTEAFLALHSRRSACWKAHQRRRLVGFYQAAKAKIPRCSPPAFPPPGTPDC